MNNLETKVNDLDVDKFKIVTIDLRKLSDVSSIRIGVLEDFWLKISLLVNHLNLLAFVASHKFLPIKNEQISIL